MKRNLSLYLLWSLHWCLRRLALALSAVRSAVVKSSSNQCSSSSLYRSPTRYTGRASNASPKSASRSLRVTQDMIDKPKVLAAVMSVPDDAARQSLIDYITTQSDLLQTANALIEKQQEKLQEFESERQRRTRILNLCQEALSQLRLDMKYLIFDLEATRRERDALREERDGSQ